MINTGSKYTTCYHAELIKTFRQNDECLTLCICWKMKLFNRYFLISNNEMLRIFIPISLFFFLRVVSLKYATLQSALQENLLKNKFGKLFFPFSPQYRFGKFISKQSVPNTLNWKLDTFIMIIFNNPLCYWHLIVENVSASCTIKTKKQSLFITGDWGLASDHKYLQNITMSGKERAWRC